jgi:hypothetical protein
MDAEDGGDIFLRNVRLSPYYYKQEIGKKQTATRTSPELPVLVSRIQNRTLHNDRCENREPNAF